MSLEESEVDRRARARLGTTIRDKYRLDRILGTGGMAVVYCATHRNQKQFAVKMLHPELSVHQGIRTRFLREGYVANSFKHAGAVAVLDDDIAEDGAAFLVMELLEGDDLDNLAQRNGYRLPVDAVLAVGFQLLDVLAAAHRKGIVHRDIKPANLFLIEEGTLKVLDFGIARVRDAVATGSKATAHGTLLGTPGFMAPEQALGNTDAIDGQTDVWAAGATLFALLTGQAAHVGSTTPELLVAGATQPARRLLQVVPSLPPGVADVIDRALAFDKPARWPDAASMRDAIGSAYLALHGEPVSRSPLVALVAPSAQPTAHTIAADTGLIAPEAVPSKRGSGKAIDTLLMGGGDLNAAPAPLSQKTAPLPASFRAPQPSAPALPPSSRPAVRTELLARSPEPLPNAPPISTISRSTTGGQTSSTLYVPPGVEGRRRGEWIAIGALVVAVAIGATFVFRSPSAPPVAASASAAASPATASPPGSGGPASSSVVAGSPVAASPPRPTRVAAPIGNSRSAQPRATTSQPPATPASSATPPTPMTNPPPTNPCKLVETLDKAGESHFSCPCARCE